MSATAQAPANDAMTRGEAPEAGQQATEAARQLASSQSSERTWLPEEIEVIRRTVAKGCTDADLAVMLRVAEEYRLDPRLREIGAAKFDGPENPATIFAGRDGLLKAARNKGKLRHIESAVVRENDEYEVTVDTDRMRVDDTVGSNVCRVRHLKHLRKGMGVARGAIVGGFALVWTYDDAEPWFAEATWEDYGELKSKDPESLWYLGEGRGNPEAMMIKVPQSIALRMACGLTGLYGIEEIEKRMGDDDRRQDVSGGAATRPTNGPVIRWPEGEDAELGQTLQELFALCNQLAPRSWTVPKQAMNVNGKDRAQLEELADRLRTFIAQREDPRAQGPETITDAVVVPDAPRGSAADRPLQGPMADGLLRVMVVQHHEGIRQQVQERLELLRGCIPSSEGPSQAPEVYGFASLDDVTAEVERLTEALRDATNGGPTVAEEAAADPGDAPPQPGAWSDELEAEWQELLRAKDDLNKAVKTAETTDLKRQLRRNLRDVRERVNQLKELRPERQE